MQPMRMLTGIPSGTCRIGSRPAPVLEASEAVLDLVALAVSGFVIGDWNLTVLSGRDRRVPTGRPTFYARNRTVMLLQTGAPRCSLLMLSGGHRAAARLVRLAQTYGSNGSLRPWGSARLGRVLCRASLALSERGAKMYTLRHHVDLE